MSYYGKNIGILFAKPSGPAGATAGETHWENVKTSIEATGVTLNSTQIAAGLRLCKDLFGDTNGSYTTYNISNKLKAWWAYLGGTAAAHAINWGLNASYNLTFVNSPTHSASGVGFDGVNQYANTGYASNNLGSSVSSHLSFYSLTDDATSSTAMGAYDTDIKANYLVINRSSSPVVGYFANGDYANGSSTTPLTNTLGFMLGCRRDEADVTFKQNNVVKSDGANGNHAGTLLPNYADYIGALNYQNSAVQFTTRTTAFNSRGEGLTVAEETAFYNAVQAYQTTLGRNV
jgi:hypothetical protein